MTGRDAAIRFILRVAGEKHGHGHVGMPVECVNVIYTKMETKFVKSIPAVHKNILFFGGCLRIVVERVKAD